MKHPYSVDCECARCAKERWPERIVTLMARHLTQAQYDVLIAALPIRPSSPAYTTTNAQCNRDAAIKAHKGGMTAAPKGARCILEHTNGSALYVYEAAGRPYAIAFRGTARQSCLHFSFRTEDQRQAEVLRFKASVEGAIERKTARMTERKAAGHGLTAGQILVSSWGYDQTNVDFYIVTRLAGRKSVYLRKLAQNTVEVTGWAQEQVSPLFLEMVDGEPVMRPRPVGDEFRAFAINGCVSFPRYSKHGHGSASKWSGSPQHSSSYA